MFPEAKTSNVLSSVVGSSRMSSGIRGLPSGTGPDRGSSLKGTLNWNILKASVAEKLCEKIAVGGMKRENKLTVSHLTLPEPIMISSTLSTGPDFHYFAELLRT
jgi:hypothetical protein